MIKLTERQAKDAATCNAECFACSCGVCIAGGTSSILSSKEKAAPDMYVALMLAKNALERLSTEFCIEEDAWALDAAEKALLKARGEE